MLVSHVKLSLLFYKQDIMHCDEKNLLGKTLNRLVF